MRQSLRFITASFILSLCAGTNVYAEDTGDIPIPPHRPKVVNVSPSYVEYLKKRALNGQDTVSDSKASMPFISVDPIEAVPVEEHEDEVIKTSSSESLPRINLDDKGNSAADVDRAAILKILESGSAKRQPPKIISFEDVPVPSRKPAFKAASVQVSEAEEISEQEDVETTLVSFTLPPEQVELNPELEDFLAHYALKVFRETPSVKMEIQAYATKINNQEYSDVRLSLARALEVRTFLINQNIAPSRLKITPMGRDTENAADDRIDLIFIGQSL